MKKSFKQESEELNKAKVDEGYLPAKKRQMREERQSYLSHEERMMGVNIPTDNPGTSWNNARKIKGPAARANQARTLAQLKEMPKPKLSKDVDMGNGEPMAMSEKKSYRDMKKAAIQEEKGVNKPYLSAEHREGGKVRSGTSEAGFRARLGSKLNSHKDFNGNSVPDNSRKKQFKQKALNSAKEKHREVLSELKSMPKPKLTKGMSLKQLKKAEEDYAKHVEGLVKALPETASRAKEIVKKIKK